jgi:predicted small metal-binding protein
MAYTFKCKDIGFDESFEIKDDNQDELMKLVAMHAQSTHNLEEVPPEIKKKIENAIKKV